MSDPTISNKIRPNIDRQIDSDVAKLYIQTLTSMLRETDDGSKFVTNLFLMSEVGVGKNAPLS